MTLEELIGECYGAHYGFRPPGAHQRAADAIRNDRQLLLRARARLTELETVVAARTDGKNHGCILTRRAHEDLREVMRLLGE